MSASGIHQRDSWDIALSLPFKQVYKGNKSMDIISYIFSIADPVLMFFYRLPDNPLYGYYLGTCVLSLICVIIGELSIALAVHSNRQEIVNGRQDMDYYHELSIKALKAGDKAAYKACNRIANDAYGKSFFSQIALSASSLWPVFFGLGWMDARFSKVRFSVPYASSEEWFSFGYLATFIACYISVRFLFGKVRNKFLKPLVSVWT
jgi:hypothetical protein